MYGKANFVSLFTQLHIKYTNFNILFYLFVKGDCVEAEKKFQQAMDIRKRYPNKRDYFLAFFCQSYGWNQGAQGKFVNAIKWDLVLYSRLKLK